MTRRYLLLLTVVSALAASAGCREQTAPRTADGTGLDAMFEQDELVIVANDGRHHTFDIYLALDHAQQRRGLMFVRDLPETTGMLFVYEKEGIRSMWMKNTYIPLDIVFASADGTVSSVIDNTVPQSLKSLASIEPVSLVLELNAGVAKRYNIGPGSRLIREP